MPSYGFGGTQQNKDFTARARVTMSRTVYTQSGVSWRANEPLTAGRAEACESRSIEAIVGYIVRSPGPRIEGFYDGLLRRRPPRRHVDRNRFGVQIITAKP